ncbi:nucleotide exchange factor GrpE [Patescibacteria group bacterium]
MKKDSKKDHKDDLEEKIKKAKKEDDKRNNKDQEFEELNQKLTEMTETAKRAMADMQNMKRRFEEEQIALFSRANANLIKELLPVLDNLDRALAHIPEEAKEWGEGLTMSVNQQKKVFEDFGLKEIEAEGQPFDPDLHEAVVQGPGKKDMVVEEFEKGYKIGDLIIRHSKVKVGNGEKA